jgi:Domain of unknown function (DUF4190)
MSDHHSYDPFLAPGPGAPQWQGTPVPSPPMNAPSPSYIPPPPGYVPTPVEQNPAYSTVAYPPAPPTGYMYAANYSAVDTSNNWMGITSLVLSLGSLVFGITCIGGIIFGHMGLAAARKGRANNRGLALAGVIIGWAFLGLGLLYVGFLVFLVALGSSAGR